MEQQAARAAAAIDDVSTEVFDEVRGHLRATMARVQTQGGENSRVFATQRGDSIRDPRRTRATRVPADTDRAEPTTRRVDRDRPARDGDSAARRGREADRRTRTVREHETRRQSGGHATESDAKLRHLRQAAEHLRAAGFDDLAEQTLMRAKNVEQQARAEQARARAARAAESRRGQRTPRLESHDQLAQGIGELRKQVAQMRAELNQLKEQQQHSQRQRAQTKAEERE